MIFNIKPPAFGAHSYDFTGDAEFGQADGEFELILLESGTLTLSVGIPRADICLIGGGAPGSTGAHLAGGKGGGVLCGDTETDIALPAGVYTVTVGESGEDTVLTAPDGRSWTAESGAGSDPGRPGVAGVLAWSDPDTLLRAGWLYGPGGGHGSVLDWQYISTDAGEGGDVGEADDGEPNGHGGTAAHPNGYPGLAGTGQGGGGGRRGWNGSSYVDGSGGAGGSGAILIRKHKEVTS
jgi:hypothetical protein